MLLQLKDGGIEDIRTDETCHPGCPTCDYGSQYINDIKIVLTRHIVRATVTQMYEYLLTSGAFMKLLLQNYDLVRGMTEDEFIAWFRAGLESCCSDPCNLSHTRFDYRVSDRKETENGG